MKIKVLCTLISAVISCFFITGCSSGDTNSTINSSDTKKMTISTADESYNYSKYADYIPQKVDEKELIAIWRYTLSVPTCSFLEKYYLLGKTVYAYAVNTGSRFDDYIERIQELEPDAVVKEGVEVSQNEMGNAHAKVLSKVREEQSENSSKQEQENTKMKIKIGDIVLTATLEDNETVDAFKELLRNGGLSIKFSKYGGFEQVGSIGINLPRNDVQTTTKAGDIVLYSGNQLVMFYGANSWAYTRIGKIDSTNDLENILGKKDITATFILEE